MLPSTTKLWCTQFGAHRSGAHSLVYGGAGGGAAFRPSQARPKSTPSVFLILSRAANPTLNIQLLTISTHVSLKSSDPDFFEQPPHMITCPPYTASPPPFIYTLCSASTCTPICQQAGALLIASVARLFQHRLELILSCNFCLHTCLF